MARAAAFFDVDGTLVATQIVDQYVYIRRSTMPRVLGLLWAGAFYLSKGPYYLVMDRFSRSKLNIIFYRNYAGMRVSAVRQLVEPLFHDLLRPHLHREVLSCIAEHRSADRAIVLVTGSIGILIEPIARMLKADAVIAPTLIQRDGRFTGELDGAPVGEEEKARRMREFAETHDIDLARSYAYGDSRADLPMLQTVGHPQAVNPDSCLERAAREEGWPILRWLVGDPPATAQQHDRSDTRGTPREHVRQ